MINSYLKINFLLLIDIGIPNSSASKPWILLYAIIIKLAPANTSKNEYVFMLEYKSIQSDGSNAAYT